MNKRPDFGSDLEILNDSVSAEVGDVLQALKQKRTAKPPSIAASVSEPVEESVKAASDTAPANGEPSAPQIAPRRERSASRSRLTPTVERTEPLENVTTRLRQRTNELLTEAALRQRLKKESPATRQDIVEAALHDWLRRHGYIRGRSENETD